MHACKYGLYIIYVYEVCFYACMHLCMYVFIYVCMCMYVCIYGCMYVCMIGCTLTLQESERIQKLQHDEEMKSLMNEVSIARETAFFAEKLKHEKQKSQEIESVQLDLQEDELNSCLEKRNNECRVLQQEQNTLKEDLNSLQNKLQVCLPLILYVCIYVCMYLCMYVCMYVCMYT